MPRCPQCNREIDHLHHYQTELMKYQFSLDLDGNTQYDDRESIDTVGDPEWCCPECGEILFYNEEDAVAFLEQSSEPKFPVREKKAWKQEE